MIEYDEEAGEIPRGLFCVSLRERERDPLCTVISTPLLKH